MNSGKGKIGAQDGVQKSSPFHAIVFLLSMTFITPAFSGEWIIVHAGQLMAVPGQAMLSEQSVIIYDGSVVEVRPYYVGADVFQKEGADKVIVHDLRTKFVLPGLIDGHVHITDELDDKAKLRRVEMSHPGVLGIFRLKKT